MIRHALQAVEQLARKRAVSFSSQMPEYPVIVFGDAVVAQQLIVGCISRAIQVAKAGTLAVVVTNSDIGACISLSYKMSVCGQQQALDEMVQKLTKQLGWPTISHGISDNEVEIWINIPARGVVLLVIDDNASITDLFERFLVNHPVHFLRASAADVGLSMARQIKPDAIILDIMMPIIDGWQLLQTLRNDPLTNTIPVIVCSVVSDPELAYSLGATHVLNKPVSRDMLLAVLNQLNLI
jgi:CheY-like chemotaxis protein